MSREGNSAICYMSSRNASMPLVEIASIFLLTLLVIVIGNINNNSITRANGDLLFWTLYSLLHLTFRPNI